MSETKSRLQAATELILVVLKRKKVVESESGKAIGDLRKFCRLPEGKSFHAVVRDAVHRLEEDGLVNVERNSTRTFAIRLIEGDARLTNAYLKALRAAKKDNLAIIQGEEVNTDGGLEQASAPQDKPSESAPVLRPIEELAQLIRDLTKENRDLDTRLATSERDNEALRQQVAALEAERDSDAALAEEVLRPYRP